MNLEILTVVWGEKHVELFRRACLKSLSFSQNKQVIDELRAKWNIFTDDKHIDYIKKTVRQLMPEAYLDVRSSTELRKYVDPCQAAIIWQIEECLKNDTKLLLAPPDTIFGDGSLDNLLKLGREVGTCVAVPHPRVHPSILESMAFYSTLSNPELVSLAWQHLHRAWSDAEIGHPRQNSFVGGVAWQQLRPQLYSVKHVLPTVYLASFTKEDLDYFKIQLSFGAFDHTWPGHILIPRGRQRTVGASDAAFILEITEPEKNIPPIWEGPTDGFWKEHEHNKINKQFISIFRGA